MRVTSKGQVTIPKHIRQQTGIHSGSDVLVEARNEEIVLKKCRGAHRQAAAASEFGAYLQQVRGSVDLGMATDEFMELLRGE